MIFTRDVLERFPDLKDSQLRCWIRQRKLRPKRHSKWNFAWTEAEMEAIRVLLEARHVN